MIPWVDDKIEAYLTRILHAKQGSFVDTAMERVEQEHSFLTADQKEELRQKLQEEVIRIYPIVDASILRANLIKARYYFWSITSLATLYAMIHVAGTKGFSAAAVFSILAPLAGTIPAWFLAWGTIPIFYNQRIEGAMNSAIAQYINKIRPIIKQDNPNNPNNSECANSEIIIDISRPSVTNVSMFPLAQGESASQTEGYSGRQTFIV